MEDNFNFKSFIKNKKIHKQFPRRSARLNESKSKPSIKEEIYDLQRDLNSALGRGFSQSDAERYLGRSLNSYEASELFNKGGGSSRRGWRNESSGGNEEKPLSNKMKVSELKAQIKEEIVSTLSEKKKKKEDKKDEEEIDVTDIVGDGEMDVDVEADVDLGGEGGEAEFAPDEGLSGDEKQIQDSLKISYDNAVKIGDEKLAKQIGNTITMFTRSHVVGQTGTMSENELDDEFDYPSEDDDFSAGTVSEGSEHDRVSQDVYKGIPFDIFFNPDKGYFAMGAEDYKYVINQHSYFETQEEARHHAHLEIDEVVADVDNDMEGDDFWEKDFNVFKQNG